MAGYKSDISNSADMYDNYGGSGLMVDYDVSMATAQYARPLRLRQRGRLGHRESKNCLSDFDRFDLVVRDRVPLS